MLRLWFHLVQWLPRNGRGRIGSWLSWCMVISDMSKFDRKVSSHLFDYSFYRNRKIKGTFSLLFDLNFQEINLQIFEIESFMSGTLHSGECFAPICGQMNQRSVHGALSYGFHGAKHFPGSGQKSETRHA